MTPPFDMTNSSPTPPVSRLVSRRSPPKTPTTPSSSPSLSAVKRQRRISFSVYNHRPISKLAYRRILTLLWTLFIGGCVLARWIRNRPHAGPPTVSRVLRTSPSIVSMNHTLSSLEWTGGDVVHVIQTRFMQQQPDLLDLGLARLEIFKTFCLPSVLQQTSQNFIWIIRVDPDLNIQIRTPLLELLSQNRNFVVVASNENPEGFRHDKAIVDIMEETVWTGNYDVVRLFHQAAQTRLLLESRLDADDGLHTAFVAYMQHETPQYITESNDWMIWCAYSHLEWHYASPFSGPVAPAPQGYFVGIHHPACVTPGLTNVYGVGATREDFPRGTHQFLHKVVKACNDSRSSKCLRRLSDLTPGAVRARTPTSAGMGNVIIADLGKKSRYKKAQRQAKKQDIIWNGVEKVFGIRKEDSIRTREYLGNHLALIAADNLKGQCTKGHSCKEGTKEMLKKLQDIPQVDVAQ